jgi:predicted secreted hydrolase
MRVPPYILLPQDQYAHAGAPAEWWWHIGTLNCGERRFGFEICAAGYLQSPSAPAFLLSSLMLTDVAAERHYQAISAFAWNADWAQTSTARPLSVQVGVGAPSGSIELSAPTDDPLRMRVDASFVDSGQGTTPVSLRLNLAQERQPLLVWGDGRSPKPANPDGKTPLERYNFYYSLADLQATGTVQVGDTVYEVTGLTWMDHEYGAWPQSLRWALQDLQLENGVRLSNYTLVEGALAENQPLQAQASVLWPDGTSTFVESVTTALGKSWTGPSGTVYFPTMRVDIPSLDASLVVTSLIPDQEFWNKDFKGLAVYEAVAYAQGVFEGRPTCGTAWNEQRLVDSTSGGALLCAGAVAEQA